MLLVGNLQAKGIRAAMRRFLTSLFRARNGATTIEYGLIGALASVAIISALDELSDATSETFKTVAKKVAGPAQAGSPKECTAEVDDCRDDGGSDE